MFSCNSSGLLFVNPETRYEVAFIIRELTKEVVGDLVPLLVINGCIARPFSAAPIVTWLQGCTANIARAVERWITPVAASGNAKILST